MCQKIFSILVVVFLGSAIQAADKPCEGKKFKTEITKNACAKDGQKEAKKVWGKFVDEHKKAYADKHKEKLSCKTCHSKVKDDYPTKENAISIYKELGGKTTKEAEKN